MIESSFWLISNYKLSVLLREVTVATKSIRLFELFPELIHYPLPI